MSLNTKVRGTNLNKINKLVFDLAFGFGKGGQKIWIRTRGAYRLPRYERNFDVTVLTAGHVSYRSDNALSMDIHVRVKIHAFRHRFSHPSGPHTQPIHEKYGVPNKGVSYLQASNYN